MEIRMKIRILASFVSDHEIIRIQTSCVYFQRQNPITTWCHNGSRQKNYLKNKNKTVVHVYQLCLHFQMYRTTIPTHNSSHPVPALAKFLLDA